MSRLAHAAARRSTSFDCPADAVFPSQATGSVEAANQPERLLMLAVLEEAIGTYCKYVHPRTRRAARLFQEAETWCASDDIGWPYSFVNICHVLGIDVDYLRTGLARWRRYALHPALRE